MANLLHLYKPALDTCDKLLKDYLENEVVNDFSIRFTWDGKELMKITVVDHTGESNE